MKNNLLILALAGSVMVSCSKAYTCECVTTTTTTTASGQTTTSDPVTRRTVMDEMPRYRAKKKCKATSDVTTGTVGNAEISSKTDCSVKD